MSEETKEKDTAVVAEGTDTVAEAKQPAFSKWRIVDSITNAVFIAVISLAVTWSYEKFVVSKTDKIYIIDYVEIINLKKAELINAFQAGNDNAAAKASEELDVLIKRSADIVGKYSASTHKPVFNKQLLVTFDGTEDITPMVTSQLIKEGVVKPSAAVK